MVPKPTLASCAISRGAHVGRHDDHGIAEVDRLALAIGQAALLQHLQQNVEDIGVRLLDLVKQHNRVRMTAHGLGELTALVMANVARGGYR